MAKIYEFKDKAAFREWLKEHHETHYGTDIFLYKKGYEHLGLTYEDAVQTALCYGWIDAVTHRFDDQKFMQYFAPRRRTSSWSISNIKRMKYLIESNQMTEAGLKYFDLKVLDDFDELIAAYEAQKNQPVAVPDYFITLLEEEGAVDLFNAEAKSAQKRYVGFILDAKQEATRVRRCHKVIGILKGEKNNL